MAAAPRAAKDPIDLPEWCRRLSDTLSVESISDRIVEEGMERAFPAHRSDMEFRRRFRDGVRENTLNVQRYLAGRLRLDDIVPARPLALAVLQARLDIPESAIQQAYRVGTYVMVSEWSRIVARHAHHEELTVDDALAAVDLFTRAILEYQNRILDQVAAAHESELQTLRKSRAQLRRELVRELLAEEVDGAPEELSAQLGYDLASEHVAIVLAQSREDGARLRLQRIGGALNASGYLTVPLGAGSTGAWLSRPTEWTPRHLTELRRLLAEDDPVSVGGPAAGVAGFRVSFEQAKTAETVRESWGPGAPPVIFFADVKVEALALADLDAARRFVAEELGELTDDTAMAARLRETLTVWFETGSHVSTAARMRVHEHTIRNRIQRAEKAIGHPLTTRRTELQVALRLFEVVGRFD